MKALLICSLLFTALEVNAQVYRYTPNWKVGDVKTISIQIDEREYENETLMSDSTRYNDTRIEVLSENKDYYVVEVLMENQALVSAIEMYDKMDDELEEYKDLKLIFTIDKYTTETELQNWEEAQLFMNDSYDAITDLFDEKIPEMSSMVGLVFAPLKMAFKSKETTEDYMETFIGYLLTPFNKDFEIGKQISAVESGENPFNPMMEINITTLYTLKQLDEASTTCIIEEEVVMDISEFIEMMKAMVEQMASAFGAADSTADKAKNQMSDFKMDITSVNEITFDYSSTWVTKSVSTGIVESTDPRSGALTKKIIVQTALVK